MLLIAANPETEKKARAKRVMETMYGSTLENFYGPSFEQLFADALLYGRPQASRRAEQQFRWPPFKPTDGPPIGPNEGRWNVSFDPGKPGSERTAYTRVHFDDEYELPKVDPEAFRRAAGIIDREKAKANAHAASWPPQATERDRITWQYEPHFGPFTTQGQEPTEGEFVQWQEGRTGHPSIAAGECYRIARVRHDGPVQLGNNALPKFTFWVHPQPIK